jgi:GST-like protein
LLSDIFCHSIVINIGTGEQFTSGFVGVNPNSKIPALMDKEGPDGQPINVFESASIVIYLAEKYNRFLPSNPRHKTECYNWIFWQMGGFGPFCGQFGHFMVYAPADKVETRDYGVARYGMEVQRLCSVLDQHLAKNSYLVNDEYTIADIIVFPWFYQLMNGYKHPSGVAARDFLSIDQYTNAVAWAKKIAERPAVQRGLTVTSFNGVAKPWLQKKDEEGKQ